VKRQTMRLFVPAFVAAFVTLPSFSHSMSAHLVSDPQILPPAPRAAHVQISEGPEIESVRDELAIIRWVSNNPGGTDEHFGVVHYGTDPQHLDLTAKSPVRLNQNHSTTVFRVRVEPVKKGATYYYTVDSEQATGKSDGVKSPVKQFTVP
jgi:hypothetical protein